MRLQLYVSWSCLPFAVCRQLVEMLMLDRVLRGFGPESFDGPGARPADGTTAHKPRRTVFHFTDG